MTPETIHTWLADFGLAPELAALLGALLSVLLLAAVALAAQFAAKALIGRAIHPLIRRTGNAWDDLLVEKNIVRRISHLAPAIALDLAAPLFFGPESRAAEIVETAVNLYLVVIFLMVADAGLDALRELWDRSPRGARFPAKSFAQAAKLVVNLIGGIFAFSLLLGKSPVVVFSGLGAVTAVLLLIFRDAILGLVAGFQLSINNMINVGDWIEMPARDADGDVIDVSLTTVKVRNWDKTITTIPTHTLISDSFKNWRGMSESGARRIKRAIHIDLRTIRFLDAAMLEKFKGVRLLRPYLEAKLEDIAASNARAENVAEEPLNGRRLTNVGTFRAYCAAYLREHPKIRQEFTFLIRQLPPGAQGLPLEIYVFCADIQWANYENVQADIFDHLLAILPEFGLRAYQAPSGADIEGLGAGLAAGREDGGDTAP